MNKWIQEHCILGDACDDVPKVVDFTELTYDFIQHLSKIELLSDIKTPMDLTSIIADLSDADKQRCLEHITAYDVWKLNRKGENTGIKDIYKSTRFGISTLAKKIKDFGTVDNWLDSHPLYRKHYDRNFLLVMEEGIPDYIRTSILSEFKLADNVYNITAFDEYLEANKLSIIKSVMPGIFKVEAVSAADFNW